MSLAAIGHMEKSEPLRFPGFRLGGKTIGAVAEMGRHRILIGMLCNILDPG